ncbi:MAG: ABC transporter substrate-binding protein [Candidatus Rokuibacteriota bacterium]
MTACRTTRTFGLGLIAAAFLLAPAGGPPGAAWAADKVVFGTNWKAQAEHGGYYYAVAEGIYAQHGLDVEIRQGGPNVNNAQLLAAGKVDFNMGSTGSALNFVANQIPMVTVAAIFQKDPQVLLAHPGVGHDTLESLRGKPILISKGARTTYRMWLQAKFGFTEDQIRPYTFNAGPFLADKKAIQQGYVTSEPYVIEKLGGFKPVLHLLADHGYSNYSTTIETSWKLVQEKPELVQRFVDATIKGWYGYLYRDPGRANALIKKDNPDMTDDILAHSVKAMKDFGIVDSGDAKTLGIGTMSHARWERFYKDAVEAKLYPATLEYRTAYMLQFVNKKVGM